MELCRHCRTGKVNRPRGLCFGCHRDPAVRRLYPTKGSKFEKHGEPTMEELDALIAERRPTMPPT